MGISADVRGSSERSAIRPVRAGLCAVTGAFGYTGKRIARALLAAGYDVRTLTNHPGSSDVFGGRVEVAGLMAGLLVSSEPPTGQTRLSEWLLLNADALGKHYASELARHYHRRCIALPPEIPCGR